jgi:non-ribosomal peptide synthetase component E (peptide arylation enzyme)
MKIRTMNTQQHIISEVAMKRLVLILGVAVLSMGLVQSAMAQASANQTVTLAVSAVYKIAVSGDPGALTISNGTAGVDALTPATDNSTTYSITQNVGNTVKITAYMDAALPAGYTLTLDMASTKGTGSSQDISNATSGSAVDIVTAINKGADAGQGISYSFSANASAGTLSSTTRTVTLTLTN